MTQFDTFDAANNFTPLSTSAVTHPSLTPSGTFTPTVVPDDTEIGVFLTDAWSYYNTTQSYTPTVDKTLVTNTNATGAKVIFYYRTLFN